MVRSFEQVGSSPHHAPDRLRESADRTMDEDVRLKTERHMQWLLLVTTCAILTIAASMACVAGSGSDALSVRSPARNLPATKRRRHRRPMSGCVAASAVSLGITTSLLTSCALQRCKERPRRGSITPRRRLSLVRRLREAVVRDDAYRTRIDRGSVRYPEQRRARLDHARVDGRNRSERSG